MNLLIDFHCHIYPVYDLRKAILFARKRSDDPIAVILTERYDCEYFDSFESGKFSATQEFEGRKIDENCCKIAENLFVFRGRQYSTSEGIEVLSLLAAPKLEEKLPARDYCEAIVKEGGIIAFSWAFGKWRGKRAELISELAQKFGPDRVILLDSRLRPDFLKLPLDFEALAASGFKSFAGSDPLPLRWHETALGSFANDFRNLSIDPADLNSEYVRNLIFSNENSEVVGDRSGIVDFLKDQISLRL